MHEMMGLDADAQVSLMGDEEYAASVVGVDRDKDVAVLQLKMPDDIDKKVSADPAPASRALCHAHTFRSAVVCLTMAMLWQLARLHAQRSTHCALGEYTEEAAPHHAGEQRGSAGGAEGVCHWEPLRA